MAEIRGQIRNHSGNNYQGDRDYYPIDYPGSDREGESGGQRPGKTRVLSGFILKVTQGMTPRVKPAVSPGASPKITPEATTGIK